MVTNPNSNLVFDFPDPTPRFDLSSSPNNNDNKKKGGGGLGTAKRVFGKKKLGKSSSSSSSSNNGNAATAYESPSKSSIGGSSTGTATTSSLTPESSSKGGFFSPSLSSATSSGDIAAGPNGGTGSTYSNSSSSGYPMPHFDFNTSSSPKLNLPSKNKLNSHRRNPSTHSAASGYISEVSEFSFDRVTVATNETSEVDGMTGQSSNISWNFMDSEVMQAVGMGDAINADGTKRNNNGGGDKFVPYTGDTEVLGTKTNSNGTNKKKGHKSKSSASTFSNVSLSDDEDNIPISGIVGNYNIGANDDGTDKSIISEISERTSGRNEVGEGGTSDAAVRALLKDGMDSVNNKQKKQHQSSKVTVVNKSKQHVLLSYDDKKNSLLVSKMDSLDYTPTVKKMGDSSTDKTSALTDDSSSIKSDTLLGIYNKFKRERNAGAKESKTVLASIIEDIQFCGLYFCGIDTTFDDDDADKPYENAMKARKEERKRETEYMFLGKVIQCGHEDQVACCGVVDSYRKCNDGT